MIGYIMMGTNDLDKAVAFYDGVLAELDGKRAMEDEGRFVGWANAAGAMFIVTKPHDGNTATAGNGTMAALAAPSREAVDKAHAKALASGAKDEGAPGPRSGNFYGGYFRDLDGNKIVAFFMG